MKRSNLHCSTSSELKCFAHIGICKKLFVNVYLSKLQYVFVPIVKCICPNSQMYLLQFLWVDLMSAQSSVSSWLFEMSILQKICFFASHLRNKDFKIVRKESKDATSSEDCTLGLQSFRCFFTVQTLLINEGHNVWGILHTGTIYNSAACLRLPPKPCKCRHCL